MRTPPSERWPSYLETRTQEVLDAAAKDDLEKLLFLVQHHLATAQSNLEALHPDETYPRLARRTIDRRITPALIALQIIAAGGIAK